MTITKILIDLTLTNSQDSIMCSISHNKILNMQLFCLAQAFPDQPPPNSVFVSNSPPPYPGVGGSTYPAGGGFSGAASPAGAPPGYPGAFAPPPGYPGGFAAPGASAPMSANGETWSRGKCKHCAIYCAERSEKLDN